MGDARGFLKHGREGTTYRPVEERTGDWQIVQEDFPLAQTKLQASRCMDCGIPFCNDGCPLGNIIPDFNDLVFRDKWEDALVRLHSTNNFPEFTGMVCPAPCEQACVLGINQDPVTIKQVEWEIVTRGWEEGWIRPVRPERRSGRSVAGRFSSSIRRSAFRMVLIRAAPASGAPPGSRRVRRRGPSWSRGRARRRG